MLSPDQRPARIYRHDANLHGSAKWATQGYLKKRQYGESGRIFLGYGLPEHGSKRGFAITTSTARHGTVLGPTRSGKGICFTIPQCLNHQGSLVALDIKDGEMALITARYRAQTLGHDVFIFDPWDVVCSSLGLKQAAFNPLEKLDPASDSFVDDAFIIAEALVVSDHAREPFWSDEARALIAGLIMHVKVTPKIFLPVPDKGRNLGQVRACLNLGPKAFKELIAGEFEQDDDGNIELIKPGMAQSRNVHVRSASARILNKSDRERSGVISTAQSNTHFLESPPVQRALSHFDFDPSDLEHSGMSIYIVMPTDKHHTHGRLLRLMISGLLTTAARFKSKAEPPVCFLLEEANALGHMPIISAAYGLMAGKGLQLISVWQDFNQMAARYENWQTMIANSGFIQVLSTRDHFTSEYLSKMCGTTTIEQLSENSAALRAGLFTDPNCLSRDDAQTSRNLITPDEIMTMHPAAQLLLLAHAHPITAYKTAYFLDSRYRNKSGQPLYDTHHDYADKATPRAIDFTNAKSNIGAALDSVLGGG